LLVFFFYRGQEFWLIRSNFPYPVTRFNLEVKSKEGNSIGLVTLAEIETTTLNQMNKKCKKYQDSDFIECYKNFSSSILKEHISCRIPGLDEFGADLKSMKECRNITQGQKTSKFFGSFVIDNRKWKNFCPLPCTLTSYNYKLEYLHRSRWIDTQNSYGSEAYKNSTFIFGMSFGSLLVEERSEALVYDGVSFLAAAGGNLGLFLGFSFFSVVISILKILQKMNCKH
jgi:hypothetical protein